MIAEIKFKNMFSFRDETVLSFEADKSKDLESYHVVELAPDVKLLKLAVIYGANASGKSNIIKVYDFIRSFINCNPLNKAGLSKIVPFLLNRTSKEQASEFSVSFYAMKWRQGYRICLFRIVGDYAHCPGNLDLLSQSTTGHCF